MKRREDREVLYGRRDIGLNFKIHEGERGLFDVVEKFREYENVEDEQFKFYFSLFGTDDVKQLSRVEDPPSSSASHNYPSAD